MSHHLWLGFPFQSDDVSALGASALNDVQHHSHIITALPFQPATTSNLWGFKPKWQIRLLALQSISFCITYLCPCVDNLISCFVIFGLEPITLIWLLSWVCHFFCFQTKMTTQNTKIHKWSFMWWIRITLNSSEVEMVRNKTFSLPENRRIDLCDKHVNAVW